MNILFFDIEANGLYYNVTKAHCMVIKENGIVTRYRPSEVHEGVLRLLRAISEGSYICGHNIINYDIPTLEKIYPDFRVPRKLRKFVIDTLVLSRLLYGNIKETDMALLKTDKLPGSLVGSQSLKAWGYRLGVLKGTYGEQEDAWDFFTEEMLDYNEQDVEVTEALYNHLATQTVPTRAVVLEHKAQWLMTKQEHNGFTFDVFKAQELECVLRGRAAVIDAAIRTKVPPIPDKVFIPKRDNKTLGYKAGVPIQRYKDFNPNSRQQIEWIITKYYDYLPNNPDLFDDCRLKIDDETFKFIKDDEAAPQELRELSLYFEEYLMVNKRLGQLIDGTNGWLKMVKEDGRIHGTVNPCGAVTGRATHAYPNVAQVPSGHSPYGKECRELFGVPHGWVQAGIDACGLELRCLAHFMSPYDGGRYGDEVVHGDIHTTNQKAAGLPTRDNAKTFIYAFLYGAGDAKIGRIVGGDAKDGKRLKRTFLKMTPALASLRKKVEMTLAETVNGKVSKWKRRYLLGLDGRRLHVRSIHSALNLLLQSAGALICKRWTVVLEERLVALGLDHGNDFQFMAWVHDEVQIACRTKEIAEVVVREAQAAMRDVQEYYNFRVQLDTEGKIGRNWNDCH